MRIAILSDVHGYSLALDRVLADINLAAPIDRLIIAGDLCKGGPDPGGVLERIASLSNVTVLQGNTDRDLAHEARDSGAARWISEQIGPEGLTYLRELPFSERIAPPGGRQHDDDLLVVHANPFDQDRHVPPDAGQHELQELIGDTRAAVIAFGHLHVAYIRRLDGGRTLMDVSAVGNPKDGDLRSKWGLATWDERAATWSVELRYVDYPLDETEAQVLSSGMPNPGKVLAQLKKAS
jgi:predicted phosphodiesterase